jgi:hypothetical protein
MLISHVALFIYVYHLDILSLSFSRIIMCLTFLLTQICDMSRQILRSQEFPALARDVLALPAFRFRFKYMIQMLKNLSKKLARISRHSKCSESWSTENQWLLCQCVKKIKFGVKKGCLRDISFFCFTQANKNASFSRNLLYAHRMWRQKIYSFLLHIQNVCLVKAYGLHICIATYTHHAFSEWKTDT